MGRWNGHAYDGPTAMRERTAKADLLCVTCKQTIAQGQPYVNWRGKSGFPEHPDICPPRATTERAPGAREE